MFFYLCVCVCLFVGMLFRSSHCGGGGGGGEEKNVTVGGGSIHDIGWAHGHRYGVIELHPISTPAS
jgi:hypothetical protein